MNTLDLIQKRVSIRNFNQEPIDSQELSAIIKAAISAPTAGNMMMYSIIKVEDKDTLKKLSVSCDNQAFIASAQVALIFVVDLSKWHRYFILNGIEDYLNRREGTLRTIYLYPMALSFIVTGVVWKWLLNPQLGIQAMVQSWGFEPFRFDWIVDPDMAIYTLVIAAVWQASGFVMALFLAGLRGIDDSIVKAAQLDGASLPRIYWRVVMPCLRPVVFSAVMILAHIAIKSFDLVVALTGGGPGYATDLPATFMYTHAFNRAQIGLGSASAMLMLGGVLAILIPYLYSELRSRKHG